MTDISFYVIKNKMYKKDIYEHLAKIYLDASSKRKKKTKKTKVFKASLLAIFALLSGLGIFFSTTIPKIKSLKNPSEIALVLSGDVIKINFQFEPVKKEIYALNLNHLNLTRFKTLAFSLKKSDYRDNISLRVEFINAFKEKSEVYLKNIPHKWQDYRINLCDFKDISNWSRMLSLSFGVEEWNAKKKKDVVYIDNLRLLR